MRKAPVLIIGGGPVGLSLSLLLSRLGVPSLLVESARHEPVALGPRHFALGPRH